MLILTYSKLPHFNPKQPDAHVSTSHNKMGLVRVIVVKVRIIPSLKKKGYIVAYP